MLLQDFFECLTGAVQVVLVISVSLPVMLFAMSPVVFYFWYISKQYLRVSRDLKRLESVNKSPVYVLFSGKISLQPDLLQTQFKKARFYCSLDLAFIHTIQCTELEPIYVLCISSPPYHPTNPHPLHCLPFTSQRH